MTGPERLSQTRGHAPRRRRSPGVVTAALLALGAMAGLPAAAHAAGSAESGGAAVFRLTFSGDVLEAAWSTCPDLAAVPVGTRCRTTDVLAFLSADQEQAVPELSLRHLKGPTVTVFESVCQALDLDGERGCAPVHERFGRTERAVVVTDPRLDHGAATATVSVQTWSSDGDSGEDVLTVTADWVGTGERTVLDENSRVTSRAVTTHGWTRGWQRGCAATAAVDGSPVVGQATWCSMLRVRQADLAVFRGQ